jgi:hypothetical protein
MVLPPDAFRNHGHFGQSDIGTTRSPSYSIGGMEDDDVATGQGNYPAGETEREVLEIVQTRLIELGPHALKTNRDPAGWSPEIESLNDLIDTSRDQLIVAQARVVRCSARSIALYAESTGKSLAPVASAAIADGMTALSALDPLALAGDQVARHLHGRSVLRVLSSLLPAAESADLDIGLLHEWVRRWRSHSAPRDEFRLAVSGLLVQHHARRISRLVEQQGVVPPEWIVQLHQLDDELATDLAAASGLGVPVDSSAISMVAAGHCAAFEATMLALGDDPGLPEFAAAVRRAEVAWRRHTSCSAAVSELPVEPAWLQDELAKLLNNLAFSFLGAVKNCLSSVDSESVLIGAAVTFRPTIEALPESVWDRSATAPEVASRLAGQKPAQSAASLQLALDYVEVWLLSLEIVGWVSPNRIGPLDTEFEVFGDEELDPEMIMGVLLAIASLVPVRNDSHLAVALAGGLLSEAADPIKDAVEMVRELRLMLVGENLERIRQQPQLAFYIAARNLQCLRDASWADTLVALNRLLTTVDKAVSSPADVLADTVEEIVVQTLDAVRFTPEFTSLAGAQRLLEVVDAVHDLLSLPGTMRPRLATLGAFVSFRLSQSDRNWIFDALGRSAAINAWMEQQGAAAISDHAGLHVELLRIEAVAIILTQGRDDANRGISLEVAPATPAGARISDLVDALELHRSDAAFDNDVQEQASLAMVEIDLLRGSRIAAADIPPALAARRPMKILEALIDAPGPLDATTRRLVSEALGGIVRHAREAGDVPATNLSNFELLTHPTVAQRLEINEAERLLLVTTACDAMDLNSPGAGGLRIRLALNLRDLEADPRFATAVSQHFEGAGYHLAAAIAEGPTREAVDFMQNRASAALNYGAVVRSELNHRFQVAIAAYLFAVALGDLDRIAFSAHSVAELLYFLEQPSLSASWHDHIDALVRDGAWAAPLFEPVREAVRVDGKRSRDLVQRLSTSRTENA